MFWFALNENRTGGKLECSFYFLTLLCSAYWDKISGVGPVSTPFTWCRTNWTNYCTNTSRFCPDIFPPSSKSQHLHWTQTHNHLHVPQLCKTSLRLPALWGNKMGKNGSFCGEIIFLPPVYLALKGSEILQWRWGGTKSHFLVWRLQLPLVSWVFLGSWWEALGMWQRREQGEDTHDQTDRHFTVFI